MEALDFFVFTVTLFLMQFGKSVHAYCVGQANKHS